MWPLTLFFLLCLSMAAHADVFVVANKTTHEVISISDQNDAIVPAGDYEMVQIKGKLKDLNLNYDGRNYLLQGNKLVLNSKKVDDDTKAQASVQDRLSDMMAIEKRARKLAFDSLTVDKYKFKVVTAKDFQ